MQTWSGHLGKYVSFSCHLLPFLEIITFRSPDSVQVQPGFEASLGVTREPKKESVPWRLVAESRLIVPDRGLSNKVEESLLGGVFFSRQISRFIRYLCLPGVSCKKSSTMHGYFQQRQLGLCNIEACLSPLISCGSKEAKDRCIGCPLITSKDERVFLMI